MYTSTTYVEWAFCHCAFYWKVVWTSVLLCSQEPVAHGWLPADISHACRPPGSAEECNSEQGDGVQRVQTVPIWPGARWVRADVHRSSFPKDVFKSLGTHVLIRIGNSVLFCHLSETLSKHLTLYSEMVACSIWLSYVRVIFPHDCRNFANAAAWPHKPTVHGHSHTIPCRSYCVCDLMVCYGALRLFLFSKSINSAWKSTVTLILMFIFVLCLV